MAAKRAAAKGELRVFLTVETLQPQFAAYMGTPTRARGYPPYAGQHALIIEVAPGLMIERVMDLVSDETGIDPAEVRRRNFIPPDEFPYDSGVGMLPYDTGNYEPALDKALDMVGYHELRAEQERRRQSGDSKQLGIGLSSYVEVCGIAPSAYMAAEGWGAGLFESANIKVHLTGKVVVTTGSMPHGQGHETTFAQIAADKLGVPIEDVQLKFGDTLATPFGYGTYGSRSLAVGGEAIVRSTNKIVAKARRLAAHLLEVDIDDIEYVDGTASVKGAPDLSLIHI